MTARHSTLLRAATWARRRWILWTSIALVVGLRLAFIGVPVFIDDEAMHMTYGGQILEDDPLYARGFVDVRGPGGYYISAMIAYLFGFSNMAAYHAVGMGFWALTCLAVWRLGRSVSGCDTAGQLAALLCSVFSFAYEADEFWAFNVEGMALPFAMAACLLAWKWSRTRSGWPALGCGVLCGLAALIKQVMGVTVVGLSVWSIWLAWEHRLEAHQCLRFLALVACGVVATWFVAFLPNVLTGTLGDAWYWFFVYGVRHHGSSLGTRAVALVERGGLLCITGPLLWLGAGVWAWRVTRRVGRPWRIGDGDGLLLAQLVAQAGGLLIGGNISGHYFLSVVPFAGCAVAVLAANYALGRGRVLAEAGRARQPTCFRLDGGAGWLGSGAAYVVAIGSLLPLANFVMFPEGVHAREMSVKRFLAEHHSDAHPIQQASLWIKNRTNPTDRIQVIGWLYEIYVRSARLPASLAAITDNLLGHSRYGRRDPTLERFAERLLDGLERRPPKYVVVPGPRFGAPHLEGPHGLRLRDFLDQRCEWAKRFSWPGTTRFRGGQGPLRPMAGEWIDVYICKARER